MKNKILIIIAFIVAIIFTSCGIEGDCTLHIYDDAEILSNKEEAEMLALFEGKHYNEVYLYTVLDSMSYEEAVNYKAPTDDVKWYGRSDVFQIYYFASQKWIRVSVASNRKNDFDRQYALALYHSQNNAQTQTSHYKILNPVVENIATLTSNSKAWFAIASSVMSVVDLLNEALILPTNNLFHMVLFRVPLLFSLIWVGLCGGIMWPIVIMVFLLIAFSFAIHYTEKHRLIYRMLYFFHLLMLVCLIFLTVPSYDTMQLVYDLGFRHVAGILNSIYMSVKTMEHTLMGSIVFIILYIIHRSLSYYLKESPFDEKSYEEQINEKTNTFIDNFVGVVGMFILSFMMPKYIVWSISAYLFQQIICNDILLRKKHQGNLVKDEVELVSIIFFVIFYMLFTIGWSFFNSECFESIFVTGAQFFNSMYAQVGVVIENIIKVFIGIFLFGLPIFGVVLLYYVIFDYADLLLNPKPNRNYQVQRVMSFVKTVGLSMSYIVLTLMLIFLGAIIL